METQTDQSIGEDRDLKRLQHIADILDNKFKVPGTNYRFGLDGIIGLIPYAGDAAGFLVSGYLLSIMAKKGAGVGIIMTMIGNMLVDGLVGTIPFLGDIFDFGFKSNRRNVEMLRNYYATNKKRPNAYLSFGLIFFAFVLLFVLLIIAIWKMSIFLYGLIFA